MLQKQLLKALCYFDIFEHPLKADELLNFSGNENSLDEVKRHLQKSQEEGKVFSHRGYFSIRREIAQLTNERLKKEASAKAYFKKLPFFVGIIKKFPFVRGIAISGSLSKHVMHENGDIDYFIITAEGRLWICRTLLVLFKKIFLLNSKKYFCLNYFVDEKNLEIIDKNIFTAMELIHLMPVYNQPIWEKVKANNSWVEEYFPNFKPPKKFNPIPKKTNQINLIEKFFPDRYGDYIDLFLMKYTYRHWSKKFKHFDSKTLELTMRSNRGVSKHHPQDFQSRVLEEFEKRWCVFSPKENQIKNKSFEITVHP